jgi:hypothetical protein
VISSKSCLKHPLNKLLNFIWRLSTSLLRLSPARLLSSHFNKNPISFATKSWMSHINTELLLHGQIRLVTFAHTREKGPNDLKLATLLYCFLAQVHFFASSTAGVYKNNLWTPQSILFCSADGEICYCSPARSSLSCKIICSSVFLLAAWTTKDGIAWHKGERAERSLPTSSKAENRDAGVKITKARTHFGSLCFSPRHQAGGTVN